MLNRTCNKFVRFSLLRKKFTIGLEIFLSRIKVHMATRWTIRHGLMLLWFKDVMNVTKKLQFIDPTFWHSSVDFAMSFIHRINDYLINSDTVVIILRACTFYNTVVDASVRFCLDCRARSRID